MSRKRLYPYDGLSLKTASDEVHVVFEPQWWRIDRWLFWLLTRRAKGRVKMTGMQGGKFVTFEVRTIGPRRRAA